MMDRKSGLRLALLLTPLVGALFYIALNWYRFEPEAVWIDAGLEARKNPYLAYSRLLGRMGRGAVALSSPSELDKLPAKGTLVLGARRLAYMTPGRVRRLVEWVDRGGAVVIEAEAARIDDPLLQELGVERAFADRPDEAKSRALAPKSWTESQEPATFEWPGADKPLRARLASPWVSLREQRVRSGSIAIRQGERTIGLAFSQGEGRVTVLPSLSFLVNRSIGDFDHAEFGWRLVGGRDGARPLMLFLKMDAPAFLGWLWREAWAVLIAAALLLALWLARIVPRFGPLAPEAAPVRRSLLEHIVASGRFLWSRGLAAYLLEALRERVWRLAFQRGLATQATAQAKALAAIARLAAMPEAAVRRALLSDTATAPAFVEAAAALHEIESRLARRGEGDPASKEPKP